MDEDLWDLPRLVDAIDRAEEAVRVELLTYKPSEGGGTWDTLDGALRRAAARGIDVRLLVADWGADVAVTDALGKTPLHYACAAGDSPSPSWLSTCARRKPPGLARSRAWPTDASASSVGFSSTGAVATRGRTGFAACCSARWASRTDS